MQKDKIIHVLTDFNSVISTIHTHQLLIRKLEKNFDSIIFINILNFKLFNNKKKKFFIFKKKLSKYKIYFFQRI